MSNTVQTTSPSSPSICIPRVFHNITKEFIERTFNDLLDGRYVERVDLIQKSNERGEKFQRAFIHFYMWPTKNREAIAIREKLLSGSEVNVTYDHPWFWRCSASRSAPRTENPRPQPQPQPQRRRAPYIVNEESNRDCARDREHYRRRQEERARSPRREPIPLKMSEKELIGHEVYYRLITSFGCVTSLASKLTGMLLEMETADLVDMLRSPEKMRATVSKAQWALAQFVVQKPPAAEEESENYGQQIYDQLTQTFGVSTAYAGKITGMLLELNFCELEVLLENKDKLAVQIDDAMKVLAEASWEQ